VLDGGAEDVELGHKAGGGGHTDKGDKTKRQTQRQQWRPLNHA